MKEKFLDQKDQSELFCTHCRLFTGFKVLLISLLPNDIFIIDEEDMKSSKEVGKKPTVTKCVS